METASAVMAAVQATLAEFKEESARWELEIEELLEELDSTFPSDGRVLVGAGNQIPSDLDGLAERMTIDNGRLLQRQDQIAEDLSDLRTLLEQQTQTVSKLIEERHTSTA